MTRSMQKPPTLVRRTVSYPNEKSPRSDKSQNDNSDNIKVAIRIKPLNKEKPPAWTFQRESCTISELNPTSNPYLSSYHPNNLNSFTFDEIYSPQSTNSYIYNTLAADVVRSAVRDGINGTIFAYGQTSSGKTHTMHGSHTPDGSVEEGIIPLAARNVFSLISSSSDDTVSDDYLVRVSFLEIYNEKVRDLLAPPTNAHPPPLSIHNCPHRGLVIPGLTSTVVAAAADLLSLRDAGEANRVVAATDMNSRSSRSHAVFRMTVERRREGKVWTGTLNFVDLAGSECARATGATGQRQREGGKINQSLLTLSQVITSLSLHPRPKHIPYRDSKLTRLLQPSLSGQSRMVLIACITPSFLCLEESRSTLKFAARAKLVTVAPKEQMVTDDDDRALIERLKSEIKEMRKQLEERKNSSHDDETIVMRLKEMILKQGFDENMRSVGIARVASMKAFVSPSPPDDATSHMWSSPLVGDLHTPQPPTTDAATASTAPITPLPRKLIYDSDETDDDVKTIDSSGGSTLTDVTSPAPYYYAPSSEVDILKDALQARNRKIADITEQLKQSETSLRASNEEINELCVTLAWLTGEKIRLTETIDDVRAREQVLLEENERLRAENERLKTISSYHGTNNEAAAAGELVAVVKSTTSWNLMRTMFHLWLGSEAYEAVPSPRASQQRQANFRAVCPGSRQEDRKFQWLRYFRERSCSSRCLS